MTLLNSTLVMDVSPWPQGRGFAGGASWWEYVMSKEERQRLDNLIGVALLDEEVGKRLLQDRDDSLLTAFGISEETRVRLHKIQADSLVELAQALVAGH